MKARPVTILLCFYLACSSSGCSKASGDEQQITQPQTAEPTSQLEEPAMPEPEPVPEPPPASYAVYDLVANRHLAHRQVGGGLLIDAGQPGFARYAHANRPRAWHLNREQDETPVAHPSRGESALYVPLTEAQAESATVVQFRFWYETGRYPLSVSIGAEELGEFDPAEGWQTATFAIAPGLLTAGENQLDLTWPSDGVARRSSARSGLAQVFLGPSALDFDVSPPSEWPSLGPSGFEEGLFLDPLEGIAYYTVLPENPRLLIELQAQEDFREEACEIEVSVDGEDGEAWISAIPISDNEPINWPLLDAPVTDVVRLQLTVGQACPTLRWRSAAIHTEGEQPVVPEYAPPRNVMIYMIDTLRADRIRAINPDTRVIQPAFERLAAEGAVFTRAYVQGNESFASHAALFSGRYPSATGVLSSRDHLGRDSELIAELARRADLYTGGYSSNGHIRSSNGFEQGFQSYVNTLRDNYRYKAPGMLTHARRWIGEHLDSPFFFYLGTVDCHVTYRSHEDILPLYDPEPYSGRFQANVGGDELGQIKSGAIRVNARDKVRIEAIYDDTVTFTDRHVGELLDYMEEQGVLDDTLLIITADHGDEFWEHGSVGHGHNVYDELVHVPLIVRYPAAIPGGTIIHNGVDTVDILPTVAAMLGIEVHEDAQGQSLLPLVHGLGGDYPTPAFSQQYGRTHTMNLGRWKVIWRNSGERRLYDLQNDPTEQTDVADAHPYALRFLSDSMGLFMPYRSVWSKPDWGVASNLSAGFHPIDD